MTGRHQEALLWAIVALLGGLTVARWTGSDLGSVALSSGVLQAPPEARPSYGDSVFRMADWITSVDPFRLARRPSAVAYQPELIGAAAPPVGPPRPILSLVGIIGGPPWQAVIEGIPGRDGGVVVRTGDALGELRVRGVGRDHVIIEGADTTWTLSVRKPW